MADLNVVLLEPEIPQNTGNVVRTCAATGSHLHLIEPLGFSLDDKYLKRSGLDYWDMAKVSVYPSFGAFQLKNPGGVYYMTSKKAKKSFAETEYQKPCYLFFGKETKGLPEGLLKIYTETAIRIPMKEGARCLNLSNAVAVGVYEALRQWGYEGLT